MNNFDRSVSQNYSNGGDVTTDVIIEDLSTFFHCRNVLSRKDERSSEFFEVCPRRKRRCTRKERKRLRQLSDTDVSGSVEILGCRLVRGRERVRWIDS